jgi:hypothetical protein
MKMRRNGFWNRRKCFRMKGTPTVGVLLSWESICFASGGQGFEFRHNCHFNEISSKFSPSNRAAYLSSEQELL